jgi:hypothetical protein
MSAVGRAVWVLCAAFGLVMMAPAVFILFLWMTGASLWINGLAPLLAIGAGALAGIVLVFLSARRLLP